MSKYRIVKMKTGRYAPQSRGWFGIWCYFRYAVGESIVTSSSLEEAQRLVDRQITANEILDDKMISVVKEIL